MLTPQELVKSLTLIPQQIQEQETPVNLNMFDTPPEFDYKLSDLATHCQTRLEVYKLIFDFMEANRA